MSMTSRSVEDTKGRLVTSLITGPHARGKSLDGFVPAEAEVSPSLRHGSDELWVQAYALVLEPFAEALARGPGFC